MNPVNEELLNEFKKLEKLCDDLFDTETHGVSSYIEEMERYSYADYRLISSWNDDLNRLKQIRHNRNVLVHEEEYDADITEDDVVWLHDFRHRILDEIDPLTVLEKQLKEQRQARRQAEKETFMEFQMDKHQKENTEKVRKRYEVEEPLSRIEAFRAKPPKERMELLIAACVIGFVVLGLIVYAVMSK